MIRRSLTWIAVLATVGAAVFIANAVAQSGPHVIDAVDEPGAGSVWEPGSPDQIEAEPEDEVVFEFDQANLDHNVFIELPNGDMINPSAPPVCPGDGPFGNRCPPDTDPITYQLPAEAEEGVYTYICRLHAFYDEGAEEWAGMVGEIVIGDGNGGGNPQIPNETESPGPPWEAGTEPPRMTGVQARRANRGARLKLRLSHPGRVNVRLRGNGGVKLNRTIRNLPAGVSQRKLNNGRLTSGRYRVIVRGWDRWGQQTKPRVVRRWVRLRY